MPFPYVCPRCIISVARSVCTSKQISSRLRSAWGYLRSSVCHLLCRRSVCTWKCHNFLCAKLASEFVDIRSSLKPCGIHKRNSKSGNWWARHWPHEAIQPAQGNKSEVHSLALPNYDIFSTHALCLLWAPVWYTYIQQVLTWNPKFGVLIPGRWPHFCDIFFLPEPVFDCITRCTPQAW